ncbi:MAG: germination protein YpeB [Clostridia bacterium]|nr:germination protein YpeB [Clostridia bacterium]
MNRRNTVKIISFCAAAVLIAAGFTLKSRMELKSYRLEIQNNYSRSLNELSESVNNISLALEKVQYVNSAKQMSGMAAQLLTESENAKNALSQLPSGNGELTVLNRFLSQVGNYAMAVSKSLISGNQPNDEYSGNIELLKNTAQIITETIKNSDISYAAPEKWAQELNKKLDNTAEGDSLADSLGSIEESLTDYPTLVYDGPYSDHILEKEPVMLKDAQKVNESQAQVKAAEISGIEKEKIVYEEKTGGKMPAYRFSSEDTTVSITEAGGYPLYMRKSRNIGDYVLEYRQALDKARRFLEKIGMSGFTETYFFTDEGVCVISFAYLDGQTICYTDLVKVGVAMDNGEIMLYETGGYLSNHTDRAFETPAISSDDAAAKVSERLSIRETALALIPTKSGGEVRCYEFVCTAEDGQEILVYINAVTGEEEDILILLKSDGGTLTK